VDCRNIGEALEPRDPEPMPPGRRVRWQLTGPSAGASKLTFRIPMPPGAEGGSPSEK